MYNSILNPVLALIIWTLLIWVLMYARRLPAMSKANIIPQNAAHPGSLNGLPSRVRAAADNYNHLHEQPTIFYALCFWAHLSSVTDPFLIGLAWGYVVLRVLHSIVQVSVNIVIVRFGLFALSSLLLGAMAVKAVMTVN